MKYPQQLVTISGFMDKARLISQEKDQVFLDIRCPTCQNHSWVQVTSFDEEKLLEWLQLRALWRNRKQNCVNCENGVIEEVDIERRSTTIQECPVAKYCKHSHKTTTTEKIS